MPISYAFYKRHGVLLRRGHSDWSASSGQPSYYFLWPAASGRARTECDIVLISLCWKKRMHLALKRSQYLIPQTFLCIMCALYLIFAWFSSCHFGLQYVAPISSPIVKWTAAALSAGALFFHWFILIFGRGNLENAVIIGTRIKFSIISNGNID